MEQGIMYEGEDDAAPLEVLVLRKQR